MANNIVLIPFQQGSPPVLTELAPSSATPFTGLAGSPGFDFKNPLARLSRQGVDSQINGAPGQENLLIGKDALPARNFDFPNPTLSLFKLAVVLAADYKGSANLGCLLGQDQIYGARGEVKVFEWPVPAGPPSRLVAEYSQPQGSFTALIAPVVVPYIISQLDWPNPLIARQPIQTQPFGSPSLLTELLSKDFLPFRQLDWPNPTLRINPFLAQTQPLGTLEQTIKTVVPPFFLTEWPNPRGASQPVGTTSQPNGSPLVDTTLVGKDLLPKNQSDWPNPVLRKFILGAYVSQPVGSPTVLNVLKGLDKLPYNQKDWPNPVLRKSSVAAIWAQQLGYYIRPVTANVTINLTGVSATSAAGLLNNFGFSLVGASALGEAEPCIIWSPVTPPTSTWTTVTVPDGNWIPITP